MLKGCITALVTPMFEDDSIDYESLDRLIEWQIASGVSGLVANGSTGEAANLSTKETIDLIERIIATAAGRVKIIVGAGTASTATTNLFIEKVNKIAGVDYLMCLTPYYVKPTQEGLYQHFSAAAKISKFPVILYNVPGRTGCNLQDETIVRLATDFPNIVGVKDATGDIQRCINLMAMKSDNFMLFSGDDGTALAFLLLGGNGVISVVSNARPVEISKLCEYVANNQRNEALQLNKQLLSTYESFFWEANPIPVKWALYHEGRISTPALRLPLTTLSITYQDKLAAILKSTNLGIN